MPNIEMSSQELSRAAIQANEANKKIGVATAGQKNSLGKESFLKLLVTEMRYQDPTRPMQDREFISQMAQFSSLEQMTNMNKEFQSLIRSTQSSEASSLLGKNIDAFDAVTQTRISGKVTAIVYNEGQISVKVGEREVALKDIHSVYQTEEKAEPAKNN